MCMRGEMVTQYILNQIELLQYNFLKSHISLDGFVLLI